MRWPSTDEPARTIQVTSPSPMSPVKKRTILFMAANPSGTSRLALDREAHAIQVELERSGFRDCFKLVTRWAVEPYDLLRELRKLRPTVVHFCGHGSQETGDEHRPGQAPGRDVVTGELGTHSSEKSYGLFFQGLDGRAQVVSAAAITETFGAAGASVKLVVLSACYTESQAEALLEHVDCVVGMSGSIHDDAARSFAIGFYGGLGEREPVAAAYNQGRAAISLMGLSARPLLKVRAGVDAARLVVAEAPGYGDHSASPQTTGAPPVKLVKALVMKARPLGAVITFTVLAVIAVRLAMAPRTPRAADSYAAITSTPPEGMALIPAAEFQMGSSEQEIEDTFQWCKVLTADCRREIYERERSAHRVRVSAFFLDRHERTNAELAQWLSSSPQLYIDSEGWAWIGAVRVADLSSTSSPLRQRHQAVIVDPARPELAALPATYVTNDGARFFCRACGLDLPTEAQWERAARGPEARRFAWGNELPTCESAVFGRTEHGACASAGREPVSVNAETRDRTPEGILHLGGNVAEWVLDRFGPYPACKQPCLDPAAPPTTSAQEMRVIRGGSVDGLAEQLRGAGRSRFLARDANRSTGFRCAAPFPESP
jgi:formylglycine-generating enzyme required for sulfatase activity